MPPEMKRLTINQAIIAEMDQEAVATRNLINVIPEDKLDWRPHAKGKSLGELAMHIAGLQGNVAQLADMDEAPRPNFPPDPIPAGRAEILSAFEDSLKKAREIVDATAEERLYTDWKMVDGDKVLFAAPRAAFWRSILMNHYYHHRGQLTTYLRALDVPLPSVYGPSADVDPFA